MTIPHPRPLYVALASVYLFSATHAADAVNVSTDGLGQVLIYPYYTVRTHRTNTTFNTLVSIVNHVNSAKAVSIRFLEGSNSRQVFRLNVFLGPHDVWTAALVPNVNGGASLITSDESCTIPPIAPNGEPFSNFAYATDGGGGSLDRTKEGYIEVIDMGTFAATTRTYSSIIHVDGVVPGCRGGSNDLSVLNDSQAAADISAIQGGLSGGATIINVQGASEGVVNATALDNFFTGSNYQPSGLMTPDLTQANPPISVVTAGAGSIYQSTWAPGPDAVSAVLMHDSVMNEFVLDPGTKSGTDWIVTFPTKRFYVNPGTGDAPKLFQRNFNSTRGSCDDTSLMGNYDREENTTITYISIGVPSGAPQLCWGANVATFNTSSVLASTNSMNISTPFVNGWMRMDFFPSQVRGAVHTLANLGATSELNLAGGFTTGLDRIYYGLPTVGAAVQTFQNGTNIVNGVAVLQNYAGSYPHRFTTRIGQ